MFHTTAQVINWLLQTQDTPAPATTARLQDFINLLDRLALRPTYPIITITGTNGKGSCIHALANILQCANYRVGRFTSPHLQYYQERICVNGQNIDDAAFIEAANALCQSAQLLSQPLPQHFFSLLLLIGLHFFKKKNLDVILLEVGVGGRLDPCNALDADIIGISRIDLDHQALLGTDREQIGFEKAGLMRPGQIAVIGDSDVPNSVRSHSQSIGAILRCIGQHFHSWSQPETFQWQGSRWLLTDLPKPPILQSNTDTCLAILEALAPRLPVSVQAIRQGLQTLSIHGRYQCIHLKPQTLLLDVAHNPDAILQLVTRLQHDWPKPPPLYVIFGMMADKAWLECLTLLSRLMPSHLYLCPIEDPRALPLSTLAEACTTLSLKSVICSSVHDALQRLRNQAEPQSLIVVTGSFRLVGEALHWLQHLECLSKASGIDTQQGS